jgi:hypothetical protein
MLAFNMETKEIVFLQDYWRADVDGMEKEGEIYALLESITPDEEYEDEEGVKAGDLKSGFLATLEIPRVVKFDRRPHLDKLVRAHRDIRRSL